MMNDGEDSTSYLYAWLARNGDGIEGIVVVESNVGALPLISTDRQTALGMRDWASTAAGLRGQPARLVRFERGITLDVIPPESRSARP